MARSFSGGTAFIDVGHSLAGLGITNKFTVACWFNQTSGQATQSMLADSNSGATDAGIEFFANNSGVQFWARTYTSSTAFTINGGTITQGTWSHQAATYDGSTFSLYGNGSFITSAAVTGNIDSSGHNLYIGARGGNGFNFTGSIADVAIWNTNLSSGSITSLFNGVRPVNVNSANLIDWWPLDGYASPETDLGSNGFNGTLTGTAQVLGPPALWRISA